MKDMIKGAAANTAAAMTAEDNKQAIKKRSWINRTSFVIVLRL